MIYIKNALKIIKKYKDIPTLYRLQGYCIAKKYHFFTFNEYKDFKNITNIIISNENNEILYKTKTLLPTYLKDELPTVT